MAGLGRIDVIHLSSTELSRKLREVGLPKTLTDVLEAKEIKGSTLLMLCAEDIRYELEELSVEDRILLRSFLREIRKSEELEIIESKTLRSPVASSASSLSSTTDTVYLRSSDSDVSSDISLVDKSSDEFSDSHKSNRIHQMHVKLPKIGSYKPLDLPSDFELPKQFGSKVDKVLKECKSPASVSQDVQRAFVRQVTDHLETENPRPSSKTIEWVAWKYCSLYPGLRQVNPLQSLLKGDELPTARGTFKEWGLLTEKIRRSLENKRYQGKRKSLTNNCLIVKSQKLDTEEGTQEVAVDDDASLARHTKRLQDELGKTVLNFAVIGDLMTAEFASRRKFIKSLDARTRVRETLTKYHILHSGDQLEEDLLRILKLERKVKSIKDVKDMLTNWRNQCSRLKGYLSQNFSVEEDEVTEYSLDDVLMKHINKIFQTKLKKKGMPKEPLFVYSWNDEESSSDLPPKERNEPYILMHAEGDDNPFSLMIGEQKYCSVEKSSNSLGHAVIQLMALYYVFHFEYPPIFRNVFLFLQQFVLGDHELEVNARVINSYHECIQKYLVFANSV